MERARLFLAFDLDGPVLDRLVETAGRLKRSLPHARWCSRDALHMTVKFFGTIPLTSTVAIAAAVRRVVAARAPVECEMRGMGGFPALDAPRVLWAGVGAGAPAVCALADEFLMELELEGFGAEDRKFVPHVTLARFGKRDRGVRDTLAAALPGHETMSFGTSMIEHAVLYSSELTPRGPVYHVVDRWDFGCGA
jgi:2'-5' RNA ligase